jgi:hypothetical protein
MIRPGDDGRLVALLSPIHRSAWKGFLRSWISALRRSKKFMLPEGEGATVGFRVRSVLVIVISWCRMKQAREMSEIASKA